MGELSRVLPHLPRLLRAPWCRRLFVAACVATTLILVSYIVTSSWSLSRQQVLERDHSGYDAVVDVTTTVPPGPSATLDTADAAAGGRLRSSRCSLPTCAR